MSESARLGWLGFRVSPQRWLMTARKYFKQGLPLYESCNGKSAFIKTHSGANLIILIIQIITYGRLKAVPDLGNEHEQAPTSERAKTNAPERH